MYFVDVYCSGPVTYCVLLKGYGRQRRLGGVESTMREMKANGIVPDVVALNAAVDAFVRYHHNNNNNRNDSLAVLLYLLVFPSLNS